ncbi:hypothetical protein BCR41DRAFT_356898, partial [Lobosporangium transversale]
SPLLLVTLTTSLDLLVSAVQAQSTPLAVQGPAFARTATRFYIQGGRNEELSYGQFFSLDLAVPWNSSAPAWTQLNDGPKQYVFPAAFSADQKTMITFHSGSAGFAFRYSLITTHWTPSNLRIGNTDRQGVGAVTDPNTGLVYLAGGYTDNTRDIMSVYDFSTDSFTSIPMNTTIFQSRAYYANVWCSRRKSILYFGGYNATLRPVTTDNVVTEFVPNENSWYTMVNDDGTLVIVCGGRPVAGPFTGDLYILDTIRGNGLKGASGPPRAYTACTIAGDQFLIWGGQTSDDAAGPVDLGYNVYSPGSLCCRKRKETTSSAPAPTGTNGLKGPENESSSSNAGAIAGGVVAAVAVICGIILFFVFRKKQHRATPIQNQQEQLDLQRRLLQLQQQQQQLQLQQQQQQLPQHHYRMLSTSIIYSAAGVSNPIIVSAVSPMSGMHVSPESIKAVPVSGGYTLQDTAQANTPKHESNYWEERAPGNPHAIIES